MSVQKNILIAFLLVLAGIAFGQSAPWNSVSKMYGMEVLVNSTSSSGITLADGDYIGAFQNTERGWECVGQTLVTSTEDVMLMVYSDDSVSVEIKYKLRRRTEDCDVEINLSGQGNAAGPYYFISNGAIFYSDVEEVSNQVFINGLGMTFCAADSTLTFFDNDWIYYYSPDLGVDSSSSIEISTETELGDYAVTAYGNNVCGIEEIPFSLTIEDCGSTDKVSAHELSPIQGSSVTSITIRADEGFKIYNTSGELVFSGSGSTEWSGTSSDGAELAAGSYYIVFDDESHEQVSIIK
jgi:hypothetical protein